VVYEYVGLPPLVAFGAGCGIMLGCTAAVFCLAALPALRVPEVAALGFWMPFSLVSGGATLVAGLAACRGRRWAAIPAIVGALMWLISLFPPESQIASINDLASGLGVAEDVTARTAGDIFGYLVVAACHTLLIIGALSRAARARGAALDEYRRRYGAAALSPAQLRHRPGPVTAAAVLIIVMGSGLAAYSFMVLFTRGEFSLGQVSVTWAADMVILLAGLAAAALIALGVAVLNGVDWAGPTAVVTMIYLAIVAAQSLLAEFSRLALVVLLVPAVALCLLLSSAGRTSFFGAVEPTRRYRDLMAAPPPDQPTS
jgi:hypothetical protein